MGADYAERVVALCGRVDWTVVDVGGVAVAPAEAFCVFDRQHLTRV